MNLTNNSDRLTSHIYNVDDVSDLTVPQLVASATVTLLVAPPLPVLGVCPGRRPPPERTLPPEAQIQSVTVGHRTH